MIIDNEVSPKNASNSKKTRICVFCGSSPGTSPSHIEAAKSLAHAFHRHNITLIYGGGTTGIMGALASTLVRLSGPSSVHGIIPSALAKYEESVTGKAVKPEDDEYGRRTVVKDMHSRKQLMVKSVLNGGPGSGFVALSGGYGTMEELMEITTWNQLGIHDLGVCVFNVNGFYDGLIGWLEKVFGEGFVPGGADRDIIVEAATADGVVECLRARYKVNEGRVKLEWGE